MKIIFAALALSLSSSASFAAAPQDAYDAAKTIAAQSRSAAESIEARTRALDATLTAMNDGPEIGGEIVRILRERNIGVTFATQESPVGIYVAGGRPTILLSDALSAFPRVYGPLIASEVGKMMYSDMLPSAERAYMRDAAAGRVFAELGGDFAALPMIDGSRNEGVAGKVSRWAGLIQASMAWSEEHEHVSSLVDMISNTQDHAAQQSMVRDLEAFNAYLLAQRPVRQAAGLR